MKKLIYLEDAIDAICKKCKADFPDTSVCDICDDISILKSLPSAEPEKLCIANITLSEEQLREVAEMVKKGIAQVLPSAEPDRKTGRWVNNLHDIPICDQCGYMTPYDRAIDDYEYGNFCPNCGAAMEPICTDSCPIQY